MRTVSESRIKQYRKWEKEGIIVHTSVVMKIFKSYSFLQNLKDFKVVGMNHAETLRFANRQLFDVYAKHFTIPEQLTGLDLQDNISMSKYYKGRLDLYKVFNEYECQEKSSTRFGGRSFASVIVNLGWFTFIDVVQQLPKIKISTGLSSFPSTNYVELRGMASVMDLIRVPFRHELLKSFDQLTDEMKEYVGVDAVGNLVTYECVRLGNRCVKFLVFDNGIPYRLYDICDCDHQSLPECGVYTCEWRKCATTQMLMKEKMHSMYSKMLEIDIV